MPDEVNPHKHVSYHKDGREIARTRQDKSTIYIRFATKKPAERAFPSPADFSTPSVSAMSLLRCITFTELIFQDVSYRSLKVSYSSIVEPNIGILNCCLPTMLPALHRIWTPAASFFSSSRHASSGATGASADPSRDAQAVALHSVARAQQQQSALSSVRSERKQHVPIRTPFAVGNAGRSSVSMEQDLLAGEEVG